MATGRSFSLTAGQWRDRRSRQRAGFSAADFAFVLFPGVAGGFWLFGAGRLLDGSLSIQAGLERYVADSAAFVLCLRDTGHHGDACDHESARSIDHDLDRSADDMLGKVAGVCTVDCSLRSQFLCIQSVAFAWVGDVRLVSVRHLHRVSGRLGFQANNFTRRIAFLCDGTAFLQNTGVAQCGAASL